MPSGRSYDDWRAEQAPRMERLLRELEQDEHDLSWMVAETPRLPMLRLALVTLGAALEIRGLRQPYATAYQVWFEIASLVLRDADVGAIVATVHPERDMRGARRRDPLGRSRAGERHADIARRQRASIAFPDEESRKLSRAFWLTYTRELLTSE